MLGLRCSVELGSVARSFDPTALLSAVRLISVVYVCMHGERDLRLHATRRSQVSQWVRIVSSIFVGSNLLVSSAVFFHRYLSTKDFVPTYDALLLDSGEE